MPFYMNLYVEGKVRAVKTITGWTHTCSLVVVERQMNTVYESPETILEYQKHIIPKLSQENFRQKFIEAFKKADTALLNHCKRLYTRDYSKISLERQGKDLTKFVNLFRVKFGIYGLPKFTDLAVGTDLSNLLSTPIPEKDLATLTKSPIQSEYNLERIGFLKLIEEIEGNDLLGIFQKTNSEIFDYLGRYYPKLYYSIETHVRNFDWLNVTHNIQPMTMGELLDSLKAGLDDTSSETELKERKRETKRLTEEQKTLYARYKLNKKDWNTLRFFQYLNEISESRKVAMSKALLWSYPLFQALADAFKTDTISLRQLTARELTPAVKRGSLSGPDFELIRKRLEYYTCLLRDGTVTERSGSQGRKLALEELGKTDYSDTTKLHGKIAQAGKVRGTVRLILSEQLIGTLLPGEILVTSMTDPSMVPAMKKAAGIVTDEGGITCHAAIVSRELKIPCITGTKIATKVFKNGDSVEIDPAEGTVTKIS